MYKRVSLLFVTALLCSNFITAQPPRDRMISDSTIADTHWEQSGRFGSGSVGADETDTRWWRLFEDPLLDSLLTVATDNNYNAAIAARRMGIARQTLNMARSDYFPAIGINAGWTKRRTSGADVSSSTPATNSSAFALGAQMSWQIDLFGKITAGVKQRKWQWQASKAEYEGAMLTLRAEVARAYINLRMLQAQLKVAQEHTASQEKVYNMAKARFEAGLGSQLEVAQAATVYYSTLAGIPAIESSITQTINSLSILVGEMPGHLNRQLDEIRPMPVPKRVITVGLPLDLLRRRPDIAAAEANVSAAAEALGIAKKDYLPTLSLDGSIGTSAHRIGNMFGNNSLTYTIAPTISWTLFDGFNRRYAVAEAREQLESTIDSYNLTVITAVADVDNAMSTYNSSLREIDSYVTVVDQSRTAVDKSIELYRGGLTSFTNVADAQINYLTYTNSWLASKARSLSALVSLYEALGGGWSAQ